MLECRCQGSYIAPSPCEEQATQEDGLCDKCRTNECESWREVALKALRQAAVTNPSVERILERRGLI